MDKLKFNVRKFVVVPKPLNFSRVKRKRLASAHVHKNLFHIGSRQQNAFAVRKKTTAFKMQRSMKLKLPCNIKNKPASFTTSSFACSNIVNQSLLVNLNTLSPADPLMYYKKILDFLLNECVLVKMKNVLCFQVQVLDGFPLLVNHYLSDRSDDDELVYAITHNNQREQNEPEEKEEKSPKDVLNPSCVNVMKIVQKISGRQAYLPCESLDVMYVSSSVSTCSYQIISKSVFLLCETIENISTIVTPDVYNDFIVYCLITGGDTNIENVSSYKISIICSDYEVKCGSTTSESRYSYSLLRPNILDVENRELVFIREFSFLF